MCYYVIYVFVHVTRARERALMCLCVWGGGGLGYVHCVHMAFIVKIASDAIMRGSIQVV